MEFEIEKYAPARADQIPDDAGTFRRKKLESNFINARRVAYAGYKLLRFTCARNVQGDNEALPHPGGCGQTRDHRRMNSHAP